MRKLAFCRAVIFIILIAFTPIAAKEYVVGKVDMGQLGNQLFIIAATVSLALDHKATAVFPELATSNEFNIPTNYKRLFSHLNVSNPKRIKYIYYEPHHHFAAIPYHPNMKLIGYFQSEKYFIHHKQEILDLFTPSHEIINYLTTKYEWIINHPCTVGIHFRSYSNEVASSQSAHPNCTLEYFISAMDHFPEDALFVVFSNDIKWCQENFSKIPRNFVFVENELYYHDFFLMSLCKHNIISNSSFSWWAAYLNRNPDKIVIAPPLWFNPSYISDTQDIYPPEWIVLN